METIKVKADTPSGFMIINKDDFDESKHQVWGESNGTKKLQQKQATKTQNQTRKVNK